MIDNILKGGKSKGLEFLLKNISLGYKVPNYDSISVDYYDFIEYHLRTLNSTGKICLPKKIKEILDPIAKKYEGKDVIVRSDSYREDGEHSFAGIYNSFVIKKVTKDKLEEAVCKVYVSSNSIKAKSYRAEHGIEKDEMGIIIQEFITPNYWGVMYTSNPNFPSDLTVEIFRNNKDLENTIESFIIDFGKKAGNRVFESENYETLSDKTKKELLKVNRLANIGLELEKKLGPSDIEFLIRKGEIYLVQRREITDLSGPLDVTIPDYPKEQFIGSTKIMRGKGKVSLPAVMTTDMFELSTAVTTLLAASVDAATKQIRMYFDRIIRLNKQFNNGYVLITPHFDDAVIKKFGRGFTNISFETSLDNLTQNKKAVITTRDSNISSHIMTIARERGVSYAGFRCGEDLFENVNGGDILSIYFKDREAFVFKEKMIPTSLKKEYQDLEIKVEKNKRGNRIFKVDCLVSSRPICRDIEYFLNNFTDENWTFKPSEGSMGGLFVNSKGESIYLGIATIMGTKYEWWMYHTPKEWDYTPLPNKEFKIILEKYIDYLKK